MKMAGIQQREGCQYTEMHRSDTDTQTLENQMQYHKFHLNILGQKVPNKSYIPTGVNEVILDHDAANFLSQLAKYSRSSSTGS